MNTPSFTLPILPYNFNDLDPFLSEGVVQHYYEVVHKEYLDTLNNLIRGTGLGRFPIEYVMRVASYWENIYFNAAQYSNFSLFWYCMKPYRGADDDGMSADLRSAIEKNFGSISEMKSGFISTAEALSSGGWVSLVAVNVSSYDLSLELIACEPGESPFVKVRRIFPSSHYISPLFILNVSCCSGNVAEYARSFIEHVIDWNYVSVLYNIIENKVDCIGTKFSR